MSHSRATRGSAHAFAHLITDAVDDWTTLTCEKPGAAFGSLLLVLIMQNYGGWWFALSAFCGWAWVQFLVEFRSSCCRTLGLIAISLAITSAVLASFDASSAANKRASLLFFEARAPTFNLTITEAQTTATAEHWPVILLPTGAYATFALSASDASGTPLGANRTYVLGPDERPHPRPCPPQPSRSSSGAP